MSKSILPWLIIVTFFIHKFSFAGQGFSRPMPPPMPVTVGIPSVTAIADQHPEQVIGRGKCGKICSFFASVGRFLHNHSDLISRTAILALDVMYVAGTFSDPSYDNPGMCTKMALMGLNYAGLIGIPFTARETIKAIGDSRYGYKRRCKEVVVIGAIKAINSSYSGLATIACGVAGTLYSFPQTYNHAMVIFNTLKWPGIISIVLNPSLDIYQFCAAKRIANDFWRDHSTERIKRQIELLSTPNDELNIAPEEARLSALMRVRMDVVTLADLLKRIKSLHPNEQTSLLLGNAQADNNHEVLFTFIIDSIKLQSQFAVSDLILNILGDIQMGTARAVGPGKTQACINLSSAVMWDAILGFKKCRQARLRARLNSIDINHDMLEITTLDISPEQGARYAFRLVQNAAVPLEVRTAAARGCTAEDSLVIVRDHFFPTSIRAAAMGNCKKEERDSLIMSGELLDLFGPLTTSQKTIIYQENIARETSLEDYFSEVQTIETDSSLLYCNQDELFRIALESGEDLEKRIGAASLLEDSTCPTLHKVIIVRER